jgi:hypothetical protein
MRGKDKILLVIKSHDVPQNLDSQPGRRYNLNIKEEPMRTPEDENSGRLFDHRQRPNSKKRRKLLFLIYKDPRELLPVSNIFHIQLLRASKFETGPKVQPETSIYRTQRHKTVEG